MSNSQISRSRASKIVGIAHDLWTEFLSTHASHSPGGVFHRWPYPVASDFFSFCEERRKDAPGGRVKMQWVDAAHFGDDLLNRAKVSYWGVHHHDGRWYPVIFVLREEFFAEPRTFRWKKRTRVNPHTAFNWVVLHEVGHLVLHKEEICKKIEPFPDRPSGPPGTPREEQEAWFFASCIVGFCISKLAWDERAHMTGDGQASFGTTWQHVSWIEEESSED